MMRKTASHMIPRPFLKWVGGKGQLLEELRKRVLLAGGFKRYHEPFVGGGALFFDLHRNRLLGRAKAFLSDNNVNLITAYLGIQQDAEGVIERLKAHQSRHSEAHYYAVRAKVPADPLDRAARLIYLNKTCYNGLYRENSKGGFNVPMGRYKNPMICDEENLRAASEALKKARIEQRPFSSVLDEVEPGDLVYFDPPYDPVSKTASFTGYDKGAFGEAEQRRLADVFGELSRRGVKAILSNSSTPFVHGLYRRFTIEEVLATRNVNSRGDRRGKVAEVIVRNF